MAMTHWDIHQHEIIMDKFRGPDQYLSHGLPLNGMIDYIKSIGREDWLDICRDDDAFGCPIQMIDGRAVSRDLTDSVVEIDWLSRMIPDAEWNNILDIGAGYGRTAYRMHQLYPNKKVTCTDDVEVSFALCNKYLQFRNVKSPILTKNQLPTDVQYDLALNIHSWPECKNADINWWLDWLVANKVPRLFVIPHLDRDMLSGEGRSFKPDILAHGYEVEAHWYGPDCWQRDFYLFKRTY